MIDVFRRLQSLFGRRSGRSSAAGGQTPEGQPLRPGDSSFDPQPDPPGAPPLRPDEAAFKGRPGEEPPLRPGEAAFKGRPGEEPPLAGKETLDD